jgi:iron complex outermembrane receptor protein
MLRSRNPNARQDEPTGHVWIASEKQLRPPCWSWALVFFLSASVASADTVVTADQVVVTAPSPEGTVRTTPHSISVITAADIARSTATSLPELLSRQANLNLQSFGTLKNAAIDIRGMGPTAVSNVLVLVNGERLNENDLSGADLSTIPLGQIERIEVLRGGGAVRYGSGAVGGVINIITKQPQPGYHLDLSGLIGSYATSDLRGNANAGLGSFSGAVNLSRFETQGYRQNSDVNAHDGSAELRWTSSKSVGLTDMYMRAARHHDVSGLPGAVSAEAFAAGSSQRRASNTPFDQSTTTDDFYTIGATADFDRAGQLEVKASYRDRSNPFVIGYTPLLSWEDQQSLITSQRRDLSARYDKQLEAFGFSHSISSGVELQEADYTRSQNGQFQIDNSTRRLGNVDSKGFHTNAIVRAPAGLALNAGVRVDRFKTQVQDQRYTKQCQTTFQTVLVDIDPGPGVILIPVQVPVLSNCVNAYTVQGTGGGTWNNRAVELGLTWQPTQSFTGFASYTRHFRNPNIEELLLAADTLHPQTGRTVELGLRYSPRADLELSATAFHMTINNEIYFGIDPKTGLGVNLNFAQPTRRVGTELQANWRVRQPLVVRASVGYVSAQFAGTSAYLPLVPRITASGEIQWAPRDWWQWLFSAHYVGKRFDGNDFSNNQFPELPAYVVFDTAVRFEKGRLQLSVGINNLFNRVYSTVAYSGTYYPMPERNYYIGLRYKF